MRRSTKLLLPSVLAGMALAPARPARAQVDVVPPMPNVLILLDTSGSMTHLMSGSTDPDCTADVPADVNAGRWFAVVQALTGTVPTSGTGVVGCRRVDRTGAPFDGWFGTNVYDRGYYLPFLQLTSEDCAWVPNPAYLDWDDAPDAHRYFQYPADALLQQRPDGTACTFHQAADGIIDVYKRQIRFGLMTFDPVTDGRTGVLNPASDQVDADAGHAGTWSYWYEDGARNWLAAATPPVYDDGSDGNASDDPDSGIAKGKPVACGALLPMEVGARGPAAPPWEGRMMGFGAYDADSDETAAHNEEVEKVILSSRPYGATPLAGMISDAADFLLRDDTMLGNGASAVPLGPKDDPFWDQGDGCRPMHILVISDGEPNLDLLPDCTMDDPGGDAQLDGQCPFDAVVDSPYYPALQGGPAIVNTLAGAPYNVTFHVVGVAISTITEGPRTGESCADFTDAAHCAAPNNAEERTCCLLNSIATEGSAATSAHFVDDISDLQNALNIVLAQVAAGTATRTAPVTQATSPTFVVSEADAGAVGHEVYSALKTTVGDGMWGGRLERLRVKCEDQGSGVMPYVQDLDEGLGDNFARNLGVAPEDRAMITLAATAGGDSFKSLRPHIAATPADGIDKEDVQAPFVGDPAAWAAAVDRDALDVETTVGGRCDRVFGTTDEDTCATQLLSWYAGLDSDIDANGTNDRCPNPADAETCAVLGAIFHSQPIVVGPPREFLRDEAYDQFAAEQRFRPTVLYTQTVDGQLHAFLMADNTRPLVTNEPVQADDLEMNELWSFVPPIALSFLENGVNRHQVLLDGQLAARNVVFERSVTDATGTAADYTSAVEYRTVLVASSGRSDAIPGGGYYYALDVTDPHIDTSTPNDFDGTDDGSARDESPKFLWQLSRGEAATDVDEDPMFGEFVPAAAITTIAYVPPASVDPPVEIAVAVLAGGLSAPPDNPTFVDFADYGDDDVTTGLWWGGAAGNEPRDRIRDWGASRADRSITIVRLDTGEILRRFRGLSTDPQLVDATRLTTAGFGAPMSGTPVAFPGLPGQVSTRIFLGDAEGMLWALDLSNPDPDEWKVKIAWDPYRDLETEIEEALTPPDPSGIVLNGPVESVPVVSVDANGDPVILFATGSQEAFEETEGQNFVVSLRDTPAAAGYELAWEIDLSTAAAPINGAVGHRVTGPLNLFDGIAYFATFVPSGNPCEPGTGRIWGIEYINPTLTGVMDNGGGSFSTAVAGTDLYDEDDNAIVFGVTVNQVPSCRSDTLDVVDDPVFGSYTSFTSTPPGGFELVVQSGRGSTQATDSHGLSTVTHRWSLSRSKPGVRVDSWASIVE